MSAFLLGFSASLGWLGVVIPVRALLRAFSVTLDIPD